MTVDQPNIFKPTMLVSLGITLAADAILGFILTQFVVERLISPIKRCLESEKDAPKEGGGGHVCPSFLLFFCLT
jgi:hypothetical protein